ncbi:MAG: FtsX-like permease family protein [Candidatus Microthrix subdominans]|uniref:FtsX-like permease family protein n=1 Tax=Candidatus Neomicrothrix sp. TaxID=2719034 RepID=UPI0025981D1C|nr:ABC transporter permease [Candidatus Microthrix sp.]HMS46497.1 FtsX-like permease family protein [Candidatus Microthrix sp.]
MIRIALTGLRGQRTRLALSALAVVLGVAFLSGVQLLGNTLTDTAKGLISSTLEGTDAVVRSTSVQTSAFAEVRQTVPAGLVDAVGDVDGVAGASGVVQGFARIIGATGEPVDSGLIPTLVTNWVTDPALTQGAIIEGRAPESRQEVVLDPRTATDESIALGDTTALQGAVGLRSYTVVGIGGLGSTGEDNIGVRVVFLTSEEAMELTGAEGQFAFLTLRAEPDIDQQVLTDRVNATLPIGFEAVTGERYVADTQDQAGGALGLLTQLMAVFGYVGLLVGGIIIANTFSILITQRTRELALMRACGASRAQVLGGIMIEASAVGTLGSLLGLGVGFLAVVSLLALLGNVITLPDVIPTLTPLLVLGSVTVGVVTTVIASLVPGWRATRISPVAAMGEVAEDRGRGSLPRRMIGAGLAVGGIGAGLIALAVIDASARLTLIGGDPVSGTAATSVSLRTVVFSVSAAITLVSFLIVGPLVIGPVGRVVGAPLRLRGGPVGQMAAENARRNPSRTTATAAALAIGVAIATALAVFVASLVGSVKGGFEDQLRGQIVVSSGLSGTTAGGLPGDVLGDVEATEGIDTLARVRFIPATVTGADGNPTGGSSVSGIDPGPFFSLVDVPLIGGDPSSLVPGSVAVDADTARANGWTVGDSITVFYPQLGSVGYPISLLFEGPIGTASFLMPMSNLDDVTAVAFRQDALYYISVTPGVEPSVVVDRIDDVLKQVAPAAKAQEVPDWLDDTVATFALALNLVYVMLGFTILLSLFGIVNTLYLSIHERTRELGLLRSVGATRTQVHRLVLAESVIMAGIGTLVGGALGVWFGAGLFTVLSGNIAAATIHLPWLQLIVLAAGGALAGVAAGWWPARRAARQPILDAVGYE